MQKHTVCIIGNPNCGKTTLFNALTGARQSVGNWPGVTVEKIVGSYRFEGEAYDIVDLPGIYSVTPFSEAGEDERIARDYLLSGQAQAVINIVDASNLERNLFLTTQLIEMRIPMLVVVNMLDVARAAGMQVDLKVLEKRLGCPVIGVVASEADKAARSVKAAVRDFLADPVVPPMPKNGDERIARAVKAVTEDLRRMQVSRPEWLALQVLEAAPDLRERLPAGGLETIEARMKALDSDFEGEADIAIANARYGFAADIVRDAVQSSGDLSKSLTEKIDRVVLNRWLGLPIFLIIMYVMFLFTQNLGGAFIDFFDILFGGIFVDGLGRALEAIGCPDLVRVIVADGMGGGVQTVATFVPPIFFLFLFLAILEDSGYMARAAFVMDRLMRAIGLPGRAFVPLIVGFGCNVPAIMATRTMDRANDRIITILMAPFMSCGARMPVYVLFATAFFPTNGQNLVFALYIIGILVAIGTGFLMKRIVLPGAVGPFVMEIPAYHVPTVKGVMLRTWDRLKSFVERAGKTIVVVVAVLTFLNSWGTDGTFGNEDSDASVLSQIGRTVAPVLAPMGVSEDNWPAAVGVFTGVLAKEAVVGTMNALYDDMAKKNAAKSEEPQDSQAEEEEGWSLGAILAEAGGSILDNLADLVGAFTDPLGLRVDDLSDTASAAQAQEVSTDTVGVMQKLFGTELAAFAYLMMVLLYMPCVAAVGAVYREAGLAWTLFLAGWTTVLGYSAATIVYRVGNFSADPAYAVCSVVGCVAVIAGMLVFMRGYVRRYAGRRRVIAIRAA